MRKTAKTVIFTLAAILLFFCAPVTCEKEYAVTEKKDDDIICLSICADDCREERKNLLLSLGHAFLLVENISDKNLNLHGSLLLPGEKCTFSWWAVDVHMGIWFNIEPSYVHIGRYPNIRSVSVYLNEIQLEILNTYLSEHDTYTPLKNCAKHVAECWNLLADDNEKINSRFIMTPSYLVSEINRFNENGLKTLDFSPSIFYVKDGQKYEFTMAAGK